MTYFERHHDAVSYTDNYNGRDGLRRAQLGAIKAVGSHFTLRHDPAIVVMPTGSGKTGVSMFTAFVERARRVLVVTPSRLVRDQTVEEYKTLKVLKKNNALEAKVPAPLVHEVKSRITSEARWREMEAFDVVVGIPKSISPAEEGVAQPPEACSNRLCRLSSTITGAERSRISSPSNRQAPKSLLASTTVRRRVGAKRGQEWTTPMRCAVKRSSR